MSIISAGTSNTTSIVYTGDTTGNLVFQTNGTTEAMRVTSAQQVGIGTATPGALLDVQGSPSAQLANFQSTTGTNLAYVQIRNNSVLDIGIDNSTGSGFTLNPYGSYWYSSANSPISFFNNGIKRVVFDTSGNINLQTAGGGISFNNASAIGGATLNDYEQGSWTPVIAFGGGSTGMTFTDQTGNYTKIGNIVVAHGSIVFSNKGSSTGTVTISLPFATKLGPPYSGPRSGGVIGLNFNFSGLAGNLTMWVDHTSSVAQLAMGNSSSNVTDANFTNSSSMYGFCIVYQANF